MTIDVNSTTNGAHWNLAFEMWLSPVDPTTQVTSPSAEIMVFFGNDADYYPKDPQTDQTIDGYQLYFTSDNWADGYAYRQWRNGTVGANASFNGTLDIKKFLDVSGFDPNWYVTRLEIGNEVYAGSTGSTTINSLSFEINGTTHTAK
jgi:hypothetical protein